MDSIPLKILKNVRKNQMYLTIYSGGTTVLSTFLPATL